RHTRVSRDWSSDVCSSDLDIAFAVHEPVRGPDAVEPPAEAFEDLLAQAVTIPSRRGGVVGRSVTLDREDETPRLLRVLRNQVDAVTRASVLRDERHPMSPEHVRDIRLEAVEGHWGLTFIPEELAIGCREPEIVP